MVSSLLIISIQKCVLPKKKRKQQNTFEPTNKKLQKHTLLEIAGFT